MRWAGPGKLQRHLDLGCSHEGAAEVWQPGHPFLLSARKVTVLAVERSKAGVS